MAEIRTGLPDGMDEVREEVSNLTDWKFYVRKYPLIVLPAVAVAAYMVVPPIVKSSTGRPTAQSDAVASGRSEETPVVKASLLAGFAGAAFRFGARTAVTLALNHVSRMAQKNDDRF